jgi:DNA-binding NarL/FixJ family response regulator
LRLDPDQTHIAAAGREQACVPSGGRAKLGREKCDAAAFRRNADIPAAKAILIAHNEQSRWSWQSTAMANLLTSREMQVLAMLAKGSSVREICDAFDITERSARAHIQMIVEKLGANDSADGVAIALRDGIIEL